MPAPRPAFVFGKPRRHGVGRFLVDRDRFAYVVRPLSGDRHVVSDCKPGIPWAAWVGGDRVFHCPKSTRGTGQPRGIPPRLATLPAMDREPEPWETNATAPFLSVGSVGVQSLGAGSVSRGEPRYAGGGRRIRPSAGAGARAGLRAQLGRISLVAGRGGGWLRHCPRCTTRWVHFGYRAPVGLRVLDVTSGCEVASHKETRRRGDGCRMEGSRSERSLDFRRRLCCLGRDSHCGVARWPLELRGLRASRAHRGRPHARYRRVFPKQGR
jgi:hypothetical protein